MGSPLTPSCGQDTIVLFKIVEKTIFFHPSFSVCVPTVEMAHFMRYNWS